MWPLCVIAAKPAWGWGGVLASMFIAFALSDWHPLLVSVCSLPLLCSLSEDWGEPVSSCDEGLLRDAAAVCGPGGQCCSEVTGCWRGSVNTCTGDLIYSCIVCWWNSGLTLEQNCGFSCSWTQSDLKFCLGCTEWCISFSFLLASN